MLEEPFRQNTIQWLERCTCRKFQDLDEDLRVFFSELHPDSREGYFHNLQMILDDAVRFFGVRS